MGTVRQGDGSEAATEVVAATTCRTCGWIAVPAERHGCERCGAPPEDHDRTPIPAVGTVRAWALVHRHARPEPPVPYAVVEVVLDAGPVVRGPFTPTPTDATADLVGIRATGIRVGERLGFTGGGR